MAPGAAVHRRAGDVGEPGGDGLDGYVSRYLPQLLIAAAVPLVVGIRILTADWVSAILIGVTVPLIPLFMVLIGLRTQGGRDGSGTRWPRSVTTSSTSSPGSRS